MFGQALGKNTKDWAGRHNLPENKQTHLEGLVIARRLIFGLQVQHQGQSRFPPQSARHKCRNGHARQALGYMNLAGPLSSSLLSFFILSNLESL